MNQTPKQPTEAEINEAANDHMMAANLPLDGENDYIMGFNDAISWLQNYQAQQPVKQVRSAEEIIKNYYNSLHSWQDANPLELIKLLNASQFQTRASGFDASLIEEMRPGDAYGSLALGISEGDQLVSDPYPHLTKQIEQGKNDALLNKEIDLFLGQKDAGYDNDEQAFRSGAHFGSHWQSSQPQPNAISVIEVLEAARAELYQFVPITDAEMLHRITDLLTKLKKQP